MTLDLDKLEALARAVLALDGRDSGERVVAVGKLNGHLTADVVLALIAEVRRLGQYVDVLEERIHERDQSAMERW